MHSGPAQFAYHSHQQHPSSSQSYDSSLPDDKRNYQHLLLYPNYQPETTDHMNRVVYDNNALPPINYIAESYNSSQQQQDSRITDYLPNDRSMESYSQNASIYVPSPPGYMSNSSQMNYMDYGFSGAGIPTNYTPKAPQRPAEATHPDLRKSNTYNASVTHQKWNNESNLPPYSYSDPIISSSSRNTPDLSKSKQIPNINQMNPPPEPYLLSENAQYFIQVPFKRPTNNIEGSLYYPKSNGKSSKDGFLEPPPQYGINPNYMIPKNESEVSKAIPNNYPGGYNTNVGPYSTTVVAQPSADTYDQTQFKIPSAHPPSNNYNVHTQIQTFPVPQIKRSTHSDAAFSNNNRTLPAPPYSSYSQNHNYSESTNIPSQNGAHPPGNQIHNFHHPSPVSRLPNNYPSVNPPYQTISTNPANPQPPSPGRNNTSSNYQKNTPNRRATFSNNYQYSNSQANHISQNQSYVNPNSLIQPSNYPQSYSNQQTQQPQQSYQPVYNVPYGNNQYNIPPAKSFSNHMTHASPSFKGHQSISKLWQIHPSELDFGTTPMVLGSGTFGVVHLAKYRGDMVAVKIPKIGIEDFQKEKDILLSLRHRNIVLCQGEVHLPNGQQGIVLEYMSQGTLKDFIEKNNPLSVEQKISLSLGISKGLAFLHGEAIFHRDLSHNNVLIDEMGTAKITDFGKAKPISHVLGTSGTIGTYLWMPPEAFSGTYYFASDIFSLGILMWEMETGCTNPSPQNQEGQDVSSVINWRKSGGIPLIKEDGILVQLIKRCLQYDPQRRPTALQNVEYLSQLQQYHYKN